MIKKDVVIIGGGASALMCACSCNNINQIMIIEKSDKIGKKILATGNGRCNLTNSNLNNSFYNTREVDKFFKRFDNKKTLKFFKSLGLETYADEEGRVYPISNSANSVLDVLRLKINSLQNVEILCNATIKNIRREDDKFLIELDNGDTIQANKVALAFGSNSGIEVLKNLGLEVAPYRKSLVSLKTSKNKGLDGVRVSGIKATLDISGKEYSEIGEVLFKNDSISGILIFNLSSYLARANNYKANLFLDFLPNKLVDELYSDLIERRKLLKEYKVEDFLIGMFHKAINTNLIEKTNLNSGEKVEDLTEKQLMKLANLIKKYEVEINGCCDNNQVFSGGVKLSCLDENLQSKKVTNLYCAGELVDVDGVCGGYNLQWAWTSGEIVGENL